MLRLHLLLLKNNLNIELSDLKKPAEIAGFLLLFLVKNTNIDENKALILMLHRFYSAIF